LGRLQVITERLGRLKCASFPHLHKRGCALGTIGRGLSSVLLHRGRVQVKKDEKADLRPHLPATPTGTAEAVPSADWTACRTPFADEIAQLEPRLLMQLLLQACHFSGFGCRTAARSAVVPLKVPSRKRVWCTRLGGTVVPCRPKAPCQQLNRSAAVSPLWSIPLPRGAGPVGSPGVKCTRVRTPPQPDEHVVIGRNEHAVDLHLLRAHVVVTKRKFNLRTATWARPRAAVCQSAMPVSHRANRHRSLQKPMPLSPSEALAASTPWWPSD